MIPQAFEYLAPRTLPEAISFLQQHGDDANLAPSGLASQVGQVVHACGPPAHESP